MLGDILKIEKGYGSFIEMDFFDPELLAIKINDPEGKGFTLWFSEEEVRQIVNHLNDQLNPLDGIK